MAIVPVPDMTVGELQKSEPVPAGTYRLRIAKVEVKEPKEDPEKDEQYPYVAVQFVIQDEVEYFGRYIFENLSLSPKGNFKLRELLEAMDWPEDQPVTQGGEFVAADGMQDAEINGVVAIQKERENKQTGETYQERNTIKKFLKLY